jgi:hypothetical protein
MPEWLKLTLIILFILCLIAGLVVGTIYMIKYLKKKGVCHYYDYVNPSVEDDDYVSVGYVTCDSGGPLWKQNSVTIINNGPGTFYFQPVFGYKDIVPLDPSDSITFDPHGTYPVVYYKKDATITEPNLTVETS